MPTKIIKIKVSKASKLQIQTLLLERINKYANNISYIFLGNYFNVNDCHIFIIKKYMEVNR